MVRVVVCAFVLSVGIAASGSTQDLRAHGEEVFAAQKCSICHSVAGKGNAKGALDDVGNKVSTDDIRLWLTDTKAMTAKAKATRKPEMKVYTLPKEDVAALVAYLSTMKQK